MRYILTVLITLSSLMAFAAADLKSSDDPNLSKEDTGEGTTVASLCDSCDRVMATGVDRSAKTNKKAVIDSDDGTGSNSSGKSQ